MDATAARRELIREAVIVEGINQPLDAETAGDVGEFGLIDRVVARLGRPAPAGAATVLAVGDDGAVVATPDGRVVASTDLLVEGRHFRLDWSSPYDVGRKAAAQSLADIAAMGGVGSALLVGLAAPPSLPVSVAEGIADGLADECELVDAGVVGGDVVRGDALLLAVTALGDLQGRGPVTRAGARVGDVVVLAGTTGRSAAGLRLMLAGERAGPLVDAHRRPSPPYALGPALAVAGATAMVDVSDGLVADLGHLAAASGVRIELASSALPVPEGVLLEEALTGGEDHALAATIPDGVTLPDGVVVIGWVAFGSGVWVDGALFDELTQGGYDHFRA